MTAAAGAATADRARSPSATARGIAGTGALAAQTAGLAVLVGIDGSTGWRVLRVLTVLVIGAAGLLVERRGGRVLGGPVALLLGVVGLCVGAGIGAVHLVKGDVGLAAVAGLVVLAGGGVLFGLGVGRLWRATPGWWRLLAIPVAFVLLEFAFIPLTTAVYGTNLPATPLGSVTPADRGLAYRDVRLTTADHVRLAAWYLPTRTGAAVVLLHGSGSTRASVLPQAAVLARHGYGVLLLDARGHGASGGTGMDFGWWGDRDVAAAVTWLAHRPAVDPDRIGAVGMSMGGEEALGAAASDARVRAVVTGGALWRGSMDTAWLPRTPQGYLQRAMLAEQTAVTALLTSAPPPPPLRRSIADIAPRPVLLIASREELAGDRYLLDASPGTVELWELPDTPHTAGLARHPAQWEARVIGFLDRALA